MKSVDRAYLAGIIDGDGSISLSFRATSTTKSGRPNRSPELMIQVGMTNEAVIRWIHETTQLGSVNSFQPKYHRSRLVWTWKVYTRQAEALLRLVLPFLKVKRAQALLALESRVGIIRGKKLGEAEVSRRHRYRERMLVLNA
jgi:hypothetical protein